MTYDIKAIKSHWLTLIQSSRYKNNVDGLSLAIGKSEAYLRGMLKNDATPGMDVLVGLSHELGYSLSELMLLSEAPLINPEEIGEQISREVSRIMMERIKVPNHQPNSHDVMQWWSQNGGRLVQTDWIEEGYDLFELPDSSHRRLIPHRIGKRSLSAISLGTNSRDVFQRTVDPLPEEYTGLIITDQEQSLKEGPITTIKTLDAIHPDTREPIRIQYSRTIAPVLTESGNTLIFNYSKLLRKL